VESARTVGADGRHLVLTLRSAASVSRGIAFGMAAAAPTERSSIDAIFAYRLDRRGRRDLHIKDFSVTSA
jgi:hypothetical protein